MAKSYHFHISGSYTPATIPLERLGEYMTALAKLLGEPASVHLQAVTEGSVGLLADIDDPAQPKVEERIASIGSGSPTKEEFSAWRLLDDMLRRDNAYGSLVEDADKLKIEFPGIRRAVPTVYGPFKQEGTLDGQIYRIGGKDDSKHIHIRDGAKEYSVLIATEALALRLRHHVWGGTLRFHGLGTWLRHASGAWELKTFKIHDFEELDDAPIGDVVGRLRKASGGVLQQVPDLVTRLLSDRRDEGAPN